MPLILANALHVKVVGLDKVLDRGRYNKVEVDQSHVQSSEVLVLHSMGNIIME